ncbi:hypothetical protein J8F10_05590 [Gemmata sp. G18]|uniref:Calcium-binding protein n=1 Tax=Gemmata palustris TaxID=2822762 RepID=A0ABS5BM41_9BACT|nr:calcium-binding protein [Gemmata palustris]MBP3954756.1 hypothetical protein [Gemmata palustris]
MTSGTVFLSDVTLTNATDAPTVEVSNGTLILRNVVIEKSSAFDQSAVLVTGGTVDLGTAASPGGNRINTNGRGKLIHNAGGNGVAAVGNTFQVDGGTLTSPYRIKDQIFDALNAGGGGLVTYVPGSAFVTVGSGGSIQRGIDAVAAGGTVNVEAGSYQKYDAGSKLVTVDFENGPVLTQRADALDPRVRTLVVTGTPGNDRVLFTPGGGAGGTVNVLVNDVAEGTFRPTGRLIAAGEAGADDIQVAGAITLPAWLYGGDGNDRLKGGGGANVVLGGAGKDQLHGGQGRDLLIGGPGADQLQGNSGDDLLIGGATAFDNNQSALGAIMAEWASERSIEERVTALSGTGIGPRANGNVFLTVAGPAATVFDDDAVDVLSGGSGKHWYFDDLFSGPFVD